jgi:hypothetical protein
VKKFLQKSSAGFPAVVFSMSRGDEAKRAAAMNDWFEIHQIDAENNRIA